MLMVLKSFAVSKNIILELSVGFLEEIAGQVCMHVA